MKSKLREKKFKGNFIPVKFVALVWAVVFYFVITHTHLTLATFLFMGLFLDTFVSKLVIHLIFGEAKEIVSKLEDELPEVPTFPAQFFGGPLHGSEQNLEKLKPHLYCPHIPKDEDGRTEAGHVQLPDGHEMVMYQPVYAKYNAVGDEGHYLFERDLEQTEMIEAMKEDMDAEFPEDRDE